MDKSMSLGVIIGGSVASSLGGAFKTVEQKALETRGQLKKFKIGQALAADLNKYKTELLQLQAARKEGVHDSEQMKAQIGAVMKKYHQAAEKAKKYGITVGNVASEQKRLEAEIGRATRALDRQQVMMRNQRTRGELHGQLVGTVGMAMAAGAPVKAAMDFETTMAEVKKVVDFDTPEQFKTMSKDILELSTVMPMAASGIGDIVAAAGQSGIARDELMSFAKSAVTMGVAFDLSGEQAGSMMANWRAGMNLTQRQAVSLADAVNHLSNNMNAQAGDLGEVLQRQGAVAMAAGLTETQTASLGAALLSSGTGPERAATAMKNLTGALTMGYAATSAQREAFSALGLDAEEMAASMQTDAKGAILDVFKALEQASPEERGALVSELFGKESQGAIMPLLANLGNLQKAFGLTADQADYAGSMQGEYEERAKTTANNLQLLRNRATRLGVTLGSVLLPSVNSAFGAIGAGADFIATAAERFPTLTKVVVGAGVALAAFKVISLGGRYALTFLSDGMQIAKATVDFFRISTLRANAALAMQKAQIVGASIVQSAAAIKMGALTAAQWAWNIALNANPIGLAVAAVGALIAAGIWLYKTFEPIQELFDSIGSWFGKLFGGGTTQVDVGSTVGRSRSDAPMTAASPSALPHVAPAGRGGAVDNSSTSIVVNTSPGMSEEAVAEAVARKLREEKAAAGSRSRGALHD